MKLTRAKKLGIGLAALFVIGVLGMFAVYHYRKISFSEMLSLDYWVRQAKGTGYYDPSQAILFRGNPHLKEVALTIDDGPHELYGPEVLDVLRQYQVPATFFVVGVRVKACPDLIRRMVLEGHEIGNHTYDHQRLNTLKPRAITNELRDDATDIFQAAGVQTTIMRPPGVRYDNTVLGVSKSMGYVTVSWTNAAKDYLNQSPDYIVRSVVDRTENGSIILLHQDNPYTAEALPRIITALKAQGYKFVTISTMLAHLHVEPYATEQKEAEAAAGGQPFVLANGRVVLTGEPSGGPQVSSYIPPIYIPYRPARVAFANVQVTRPSNGTQPPGSPQSKLNVATQQPVSPAAANPPSASQTGATGLPQHAGDSSGSPSSPSLPTSSNAPSTANAKPSQTNARTTHSAPVPTTNNTQSSAPASTTPSAPAHSGTGLKTPQRPS